MRPPVQPISQDEARRLRQENEDLRTVLRALTSCSGMSDTIRAIAMNTLEPGSGDRWLDSRGGEHEKDGAK